MSMNYKRLLTSQWEALCNDFSSAYEEQLLRGEAPKSLDDWYSVRVHRWSSVVYTEGQVLDSLGNTAFSDSLRRELKAFRFSRVPQNEVKNGFSAPLIGVAVAVVTALLTKLVFHWALWKTVLLCLAVFGGATVPLYEIKVKKEKEEAARVKQAYLGQLVSRKEALLKLCDQFSIE